MARYYIASCVFTSQFPELSLRIRKQAEERFGLTTPRCCIPSYKIRDFEERMPEGPLREAWAALPDSAPFAPGDEIYSLCHNCNNIIEEMHPGIHVRSLWELLDETPAFPLPDLSGLTAVVQDCWRSRDRAEEQAAVRSLLTKMKVNLLEAPDNHADTRFCGISLLRPQPPPGTRSWPRSTTWKAPKASSSPTRPRNRKPSCAPTWRTYPPGRSSATATTAWKG